MYDICAVFCRPRDRNSLRVSKVLISNCKADLSCAEFMKHQAMEKYLVVEVWLCHY
jgi:hypothetical protein